MVNSWRSPETEQKYDALKQSGGLAKECKLCTLPSLQDFSHWKILLNNFPYDAVATTHHMIVPIRHVTEQDLNEEEKAELMLLKNGFINDNYDYCIEATHKTKSIPAHVHWHLVVIKDFAHV